MKPSLNIRKMRTRFTSFRGDTLAVKERLNITAIRSIDPVQNFSHESLDEILLKVAPVEEITLPAEYEEASGIWSIKMLHQDIADIESDQCEKAILSWCLNIFSRSEAGRQLVQESAAHGWHLGMEDLGGHDFHLDVPEKTIILDNHGMRAAAIARSPYFINATMVSLVRALRDVWQEKRHGGFDEHYGPEDILMLERVRAADLDVVSVLIASELRNEGYGDLWRHLIGSQEGDIAMAFASYENNQKALTNAFRQWFANEERVNATDHETLDYLDSIVASCPGQNPFGKRRPTAIGVEILSCLPDKSAYLKGMGAEIMRDPTFAGLNDTINQSHFMQIIGDMQITYAGGVPFRDAKLASLIFPAGSVSDENDTIH